MGMRFSNVAATLAVLFLAASSQAAVITFTGGTVTRLDTSTETTNGSVIWDDVDYYEEAGFRLDFLPNSGSAGFSTNVGTYYGGGNDVIHAHWETGNFGNVTEIEITKIGGGTFDLNYFVLTSNTAFGGGAATGAELAYIEGFNNNVSTGAPVLLPSEDWGFPGVPVYLGSAFDTVDRVVFTAVNPVDCFGMDEFYIDEPAPAASATVAAPVASGGALGATAVFLFVVAARSLTRRRLVI